MREGEGGSWRLRRGGIFSIPIKNAIGAVGVCADPGGCSPSCGVRYRFRPAGPCPAASAAPGQPYRAEQGGLAAILTTLYEGYWQCF